MEGDELIGNRKQDIILLYVLKCALYMQENNEKRQHFFRRETSRLRASLAEVASQS